MKIIKSKKFVLFSRDNEIAKEKIKIEQSKLKKDYFVASLLAMTESKRKNKQ